MIDDWKSEIVKGVMIQQRIEELDRDGLWDRHLPGVAAGEVEIAATEERIGFPLDPQYRRFSASRTAGDASTRLSTCSGRPSCWVHRR